MLRKILIFAILLALALWALWEGLRPDLGRGPRVGALAPDFTLSDQSQRSLSLSSLKGKVVLLNFWATWCGPCQYEMPSLEALSQKFKNRGLVVLGVSLDEEGWPPIREFLQKVPVTFPILNDAEQKVTELYQTFRIPETYLIDREGRIADKIVGPQDYNEDIFSRKIERLLQQ
jgi:peroxiredoxin